MKVFAFLMAFLVLTLSMMPCADAAVHGTGESSVSALQAAEGHHDESSDTCPPFCQCSCCAGAFVNHVAPAVADITEVPSILRFPHTPASVYDRSLPVWQPPQLG